MTCHSPLMRWNNPPKDGSSKSPSWSRLGNPSPLAGGIPRSSRTKVRLAESRRATRLAVRSHRIPCPSHCRAKTRSAGRLEMDCHSQVAERGANLPILSPATNQMESSVARLIAPTVPRKPSSAVKRRALEASPASTRTNPCSTATNTLFALSTAKPCGDSANKPAFSGRGKGAKRSCFRRPIPLPPLTQSAPSGAIRSRSV